MTLVIALVVPRSETVRTGSLVKLRDSVPLNDGGTIPRGHRSLVEDVSVIDGHVVVRIKAPDGTLRWVAKGMTLPA